MAASYPSSVKSFTAINNGDTVTDTMWEEAYDEITAMQQALLTTGLAHDLKFTDATYDIGKSGATRPRDGFFSRDVTVGRDAVVAGTLGVTGATTFNGVQTAAAQPRCRVYNNTNQSVNNDTDTALTFDTEDFDVGGLHSTSANTSRITIPTGGDGLYLIVAHAFFATNSTGYRRFYFQKNGSAHGSAVEVDGDAGNADLLGVSNQLLVPLVATDYIEAFVRQTSGGALTVGAGGTSRIFANQIFAVKLW